MNKQLVKYFNRLIVSQVKNCKSMLFFYSDYLDEMSEIITNSKVKDLYPLFNQIIKILEEL